MKITSKYNPGDSVFILKLGNVEGTCPGCKGRKWVRVVGGDKQPCGRCFSRGTTKLYEQEMYNVVPAMVEAVHISVYRDISRINYDIIPEGVEWKRREEISEDSALLFNDRDAAEAKAQILNTEYQQANSTEGLDVEIDDNVDENDLQTAPEITLQIKLWPAPHLDDNETIEDEVIRELTRNSTSIIADFKIISTSIPDSA